MFRVSMKPTYFETRLAVFVVKSDDGFRKIVLQYPIRSQVLIIFVDGIYYHLFY